MKKKILLTLAFVLTIVCLITVSIVNVFAENEQITVSYLNVKDITSDSTTSLDTVAYENGKQIVGKGEKFTLPTTANLSYVGQEGYHLIWYTQNGRTYKGGETVSFDEDTMLFRCVAKECYTMTDINYAIKNDSRAAIMMTDITTTESMGAADWNAEQGMLILNGFTLNINKNSSNLIGGQRTHKIVIGEGTINANNPDNKLGEYNFFNAQSHGHSGSNNRTVVGVDVTINAPNYWLVGDGDGSCNNHYPWVRIYGTINCYGLFKVSNINNRAPFMEIYEGANVTITGPNLFKDQVTRVNNSKYSFNCQSFELRIYGGTFHLPSDATNESFWTNDNLDTYTVGNVTYFNYGGDSVHTKDIIRIFGGSFVLPDNAVPAISEYLASDWIGAIPSGGNGLYANKDTSTYHATYLTRPGYKLVFDKYTIAEGAYGKLTVTDYVDGTLTGTYYYQMTLGTLTFTDPYDSSIKSFNHLTSLKAFELNAETGEYTETTKFGLSFGEGTTVLFKSNVTSVDYKLQNLEANNTIFQVVVPATCEHNFTGEPIEANCEHGAYADYNCAKCGHNVYFSWGEKTEHDYTLGEHVQATASSLGSKAFACSMCGDSRVISYSLDPTGYEVNVTIRNDDGTFENITVFASDVFEFSKVGAGGDYIYTLSGIKAFENYKIRNIYAVTIPAGILYVNITTHNYEKYNNVEYGLVELTILEGSTVNIQNIGNLRRLEKITICQNTDVSFSSGASYYSPNNEKRNMQKITTIDLSAGNHTVTFIGSSFSERSTLTTLLFGQNATYSFGSYSFNKCGITELVFPANSEYTFGSYSFSGNKMESISFPDNRDLNFSQSVFEGSTLKEVEFGENSNYTIGNYCFYNTQIQKVVLAKNSTYTIGYQAFISPNLTEIDMSAGNMNVTLNSGAFNCWFKYNNVEADNANITSIKFGENSTYTILKQAFARVDIETLKLAGNSTYAFSEYAFDNCKTITAIDASAENVTVTWHGSSMRNLTTLVSFIFGKNGNYTFNGDSFNKTGITELVLADGTICVFSEGCFNSTSIEKIDASAKNVNVTFKYRAFKDETTLAELFINGEDSTYDIANEAFYKAAVKTLTLGKGSTYTFARYCFSSTQIESIDATASNVTANFQSNAFTNMSALTYLAFGENSSYVFGDYAFSGTNPTNDIVFSNTSTFQIGKEAFKQTDFATVTFEDSLGDTPYVTFTGSSAFYECTAKELYIGKNIAITNYPFKNMKNVEKLIIMDGVTHASEYEFENMGSADFKTPLVVYNHSTDLVFNKGLFNNCDGIVLYTITDNIGTRNDVFVNCGDVTTDNGTIPAWTVILGLPHALVKDQIDPTCTEVGGEIWVGDGCPCGLVIATETTVNVYEKKHNITSSTEFARQDTYTVDIIDALGHNKVDLIEIIYASDIKFFGKGDGHYTCSRCEDIAIEKEEFAPIFKFLGVSHSEAGEVTNAIIQGFMVDREIQAIYNEHTENDIVGYGLVAGTVLALGENAEIFDIEGNVNNSKAGVVNISARQESYDVFEMRVAGLEGTVEIGDGEKIDLAKIQIYCCGYYLVKELNGVASYYANNGVVTETLSGAVDYESISKQ